MIETQRAGFLRDIVIGAIENNGYGWFALCKYSPDDGTATIEATDDLEIHEVTPRVIAKGLGIIARARVSEATDSRGETERFYVNARTGQRLYLSRQDRKAIMDASRDNDAVELDVVRALAILEIGLFGAVTYA